MSSDNDLMFENNPVNVPVTEKPKKPVTNKLLLKLKILDGRKAEVRPLSEGNKRILTSKCTILTEDKLEEINKLSYEKSKLERENLALRETIQELHDKLRIEKEFKSSNQSVLEQQSADIDRLQQKINRYKIIKEELESEIKSIKSKCALKCQEIAKLKTDTEKANQ